MPLSVQKLERTEIIRRIQEVINANADSQIIDCKWSEESAGTLIFVTTGGDELPIDLTRYFLLRSDGADRGGVTPANENVPGTIRTAPEDVAKKGLDDTMAITPKTLAAVLAAGLEEYKGATLDLAIKNGADTKRTPKFGGGVNADLPAPPEGIELESVLVGPDGTFYKGRGVVGGGDDVETWTYGDILVMTPIEVEQPTAPRWVGSVDFIDCVRGVGVWVLNLTDTRTPGVARLVIDGKLIETKTASAIRTDVNEFYNLTGTVLAGLVFLIPEAYKDGQQHTIEVLLGPTGRIEPKYNTSTQIVTCGTPPVGEPYPVQYSVIGRSSITKGVAGDSWSIQEKLSNGVLRAYSGSAAPDWSVSKPTGLLLTPNVGNKTLNIEASDGAENFDIRALIGDAIAVPWPVQVLTPECVRPTGLTTYRAFYNVVQGGSARLFNTLTDANNTAGAIFDGSLVAVMSPNPAFPFQAAGLAVGTPVYNGLTTSCEKLSPAILVVVDQSGMNTIKKAIQVFDGKIIAVESSTYGSVANRPPVRNGETGFVTSVIGQTKTDFLPASRFSDPDLDPLTRDVQFQKDAETAWGPLPSWASYDAATGALRRNVPRMSPSFFEAGKGLASPNYRYRYLASDGKGGVAYDEFPERPTASGGFHLAYDFSGTTEYSFAGGLFAGIGTWLEQGGVLRQTSSAVTSGSKVFMDTQQSAGRFMTLAKIRPTTATIGELGVGLQFAANSASGFSFFLQNATTVALINQNVGVGPTAPFATAQGNWYLMRLLSEKVGNTMTLRARIWADGTAEPEAWTLVWENQPALNGQPALMGGNAAGTARAEFDYWITYELAN